MAYWVGGVGSTYYGRTDYDRDGSFVTTEWLILVWIPIIPVGSYRVWPKIEKRDYFVYSSRRYLATRRVPLCWQQILQMYLLYGAIAGVVWLSHVIRING